MTFVKYMHVEKVGHPEVNDILEGVVTVYPKLDGTNASLWYSDGLVQAGSRNRHLALGQDNAGFLTWARENEAVASFFNEHPNLRLYGEWLVPHSLKTYREDAWRRFWIFDVRENGELVPAEHYHDEFEKHGLDYIMPLAMIDHPSETQLLRIMNETNTFLINDGAGPGEGIVIKRYGKWRNQFGHQVWAKMVRNEFKEMNRKSFGMKVTSGERQVESEIVDEFVTSSLVKKELAKIVHEICSDNFNVGLHDTNEMLEYYNEKMLLHRGKIIPRLLQTVFYCLIQEEGWAFVKKFKNPTIDFAKLHRLCIVRTKELAPELF